MNISWLDFSERDTKRTMSILDLLSEPDVVDELGVGVIRDHFANEFFPGTSTLHTKAKYFLLTAYIFTDLEKNTKAQNYKEFITELNSLEKECAETLLNSIKDKNSQNIYGIIGWRNLTGKQKSWVKRGPAEVYWNGLKLYQIFRNDLSLKQYAIGLVQSKKENDNIKRLKKLHKSINEDGLDTSVPSYKDYLHLWNTPKTYNNWKEELKKPNAIELNYEEAVFLKNQIIKTHPNSMLGIILENYMEEFAALENNEDLFKNLGNIILKGEKVPKSLKQEYKEARDVAEFLHYILMRYNVVLANDDNNTNIAPEWKKEINKKWNDNKCKLKAVAKKVDIDKVCLEVNRDDIKGFLKKVQKKILLSNNIDDKELDELIIKREGDKKSGKARLGNTVEKVERWHGIKNITYRVSYAQRLVKDIMEGLNKC